MESDQSEHSQETGRKGVKDVQKKAARGPRRHALSLPVCLEITSFSPPTPQQQRFILLVHIFASLLRQQQALEDAEPSANNVRRLHIPHRLGTQIWRCASKHRRNSRYPVAIVLCVRVFWHSHPRPAKVASPRCLGSLPTRLSFKRQIACEVLFVLQVRNHYIMLVMLLHTCAASNFASWPFKPTSDSIEDAEGSNRSVSNILTNVTCSTCVFSNSPIWDLSTSGAPLLYFGTSLLPARRKSSVVANSMCVTFYPERETLPSQAWRLSPSCLSWTKR